MYAIDVSKIEKRKFVFKTEQERLLLNLESAKHVSERAATLTHELIHLLEETKASKAAVRSLEEEINQLAKKLGVKPLPNKRRKPLKKKSSQ